MTKRQTFTKEFKLEAIRLLKTTDRTGNDIARELGIRRNMLYKWQDEIQTKGDNAFKGSGRTATSTSKVNDLKQENKRLKEDVEILKKAAAYFARELK